eukprot:3350437-Prymnesium_polylepis.1
MSVCDEGITGGGHCHCSSADCESDATLSFLQLVVASNLTHASLEPADRNLLQSTPAFEGADASGATQYQLMSPTAVESLDLALSVSQWNARAEVSVRRPGETSRETVCVFVLWPNQTTTLGADVVALNDGVMLAFGAAAAHTSPTLASGSELLMRTCRFTVGIGANDVRVATTSPSGAVAGTYRLTITR